MANISDRIKRSLASIEALRKDLVSLDEDHDAAEAIARVLDGRRNELAELDQQTARAREVFTKEDAEHTRWREVSAKERAKGNAEIDRLHAELESLDVKVKETRAEHDNILRGIAALHQRLRV